MATPGGGHVHKSRGASILRKFKASALSARRREMERRSIERALVNLSSDEALLDFACRIRKEFPHLRSLADLCEQRASADAVNDAKSPD